MEQANTETTLLPYRTEKAREMTSRTLAIKTKLATALFSSEKILQNFSDSLSHRIFGHMHEVLNIDKK
jgi:hypothetical protein